MRPNRLVILGCSATKNPAPGYMPAIERYNGPLWQTLRYVDPCGARASCGFVSAYYGFGGAARPIMDYSLRMTPAIARMQIAGGLEKRWPLPPSRKTPVTWGNDALSEIGHLSNWRARPFEEVAIVGGELYIEVMRAFVDMFRDDGHVLPDARLTVINDQIGYMRQQLREWLLS